MKKFIIGLIVVLLLFLGGWALVQWDSASYEEDLQEAETALLQLEQLLQGEDVVFLQTPVFHFIPVAHAAEMNTEEPVSDLVKKVVKHTEKAIQKVQKNTDAQLLYPVLQQINTLQERTIDVLSEALEVVNEQEMNAVVEGLESTVLDNAQVKDSLDVVNAALERGDLVVDLNSGTFNLSTGLITDGKITDIGSTPEPEPTPVPDEGDDKLTDNDGKLTGPGEGDAGDEEDEVIVACGRANVVMNLNQGGMDPDAQKKMEQIREEFAYCDQNGQGENCQMMKIKGLCIALQSKVQNSVRQMEKQGMQDATVKGKR